MLMLGQFWNICGNIEAVMRGVAQRVLQKFCVIQLFSTCGNAVVLKLCAHVTEDVPSTRAKFRSNWLKMMW